MKGVNFQKNIELYHAKFPIKTIIKTINLHNEYIYILKFDRYI